MMYNAFFLQQNSTQKRVNSVISLNRKMNFKTFKQTNNMKTFLYITALLICVKAQCQSDRCKDALLTPTVFSKHKSSHLEYAWLSLVTKENYEETKKKAKGKVPGYFDGDFENFKIKRTNFYTSHDIHLSTAQSEDVVTSYLPKPAYMVWEKCMNAQNGLNAWPVETNKNGATLIIKWNPVPGLEELMDIKIKIYGIRNSSDFAGFTKMGRGEKSFALVRQSPETEIRGTINATANGGSYQMEFYLAPYDVEIASKKPGISLCSCKGHGGVEGVKFWGLKGEICNGIAAWGHYEDECRVVEKIGHCKGHGGVEGVTSWGPYGEPCYGMPWGTYGGTGVDVSPMRKEVKVCKGKGEGNILGGMDLWGPSTEQVGGFAGWNGGDNYNASCTQ